MRRSVIREPRPRKIVVEDGQIVATIDWRGTEVPIPPCCTNPVACEKPECWTRVAELPPGGAR